MRTFVALAAIAFLVSANAQEGARFCGDEGIWLQILGSGDLDLDNDRAAASYIVWIDQQAVLLVDAGAGTALRFDQSNANFADLDAIVLSNIDIRQVSDLPAVLVGSFRSYRERHLTIFGPSGDGDYPSVTEFVQRILGEDGPFPALAPLLTVRSPNGYHLRTREVFAKGVRRWAEFGTERLELSAIPVNHGEIPSLAWRVDIGEHAIVFALALNNLKDRITDFSNGADAIVFTHALPVGTQGAPTEKYLLPRQIGRISANAEARFIVLGGRGWRTIGRENRTMEEVNKYFDGTIIFPDDLECWGL